MVIPTVFDKKKSIVALQNDGGTAPYSFQSWKSVIHRGQATVTGGAFSFEFVVPKDIAYQYGPGRMAFYAESMDANAHGHHAGTVVGGSDPNAALDTEGPTVNLFMNDNNFVPGRHDG